MRKLLCYTMLILCMFLIAMPAMAQNQDYASCPLSAMVSTATATTQIVAAPPSNTQTAVINGTTTSVSAGKRIKVCSVEIEVNQTTTAADFGLIYGTGTNCVTGPTNVTPQWTGTVSVIDRRQIVYGPGGPLAVPTGKALCMKLSSAPTNAKVLVTYAIS